MHIHIAQRVAHSIEANCKRALVCTPCRDQKREKVNPFLPYEEDLWVCHLSATHTLLLNKFNVVAHHLICVTRTFEQQTAPLNAADLAATWQAMQVAHSCCGTHVHACSTLPADMSS